MLAHDALLLGVKHVDIHRAGDWWAVASDEDWLAYDNDLGELETFNRSLEIPGHFNFWPRPKRSEIIIRALADSVFTVRAARSLS
jgi:hypothetical protein